MEYDVFISYSRKDTAIANRICRAFDTAGISYFIDRQGIGGGMEFPVILAEAIEKSKLFLFLASENSYKSKFTNNEVLYAFNEKPHNTLIPFIIDETQLPSALRFTFASINIRNLKEHPIETTLVDDVLALIGRTKTTITTSSHDAAYSFFSFRKIKNEEKLDELFSVIKQQEVTIDKEDFLKICGNTSEIVYSFLPLNNRSTAISDVFILLKDCIEQNGLLIYKNVLLYINVIEEDKNELSIEQLIDGTDKIINNLPDCNIIWGYGNKGVRSEMLVIMSK